MARDRGRGSVLPLVPAGTAVVLSIRVPLGADVFLLLCGPFRLWSRGWSRGWSRDWPAEFYRWVRHAHIPASVYMDYWATGGVTRDAALDRLHAIKDLIEPCGFLFNATKDAVGQRLEFLGVLFDTISFTLEEAAILRAHHATLSNVHTALTRNHSLFSQCTCLAGCARRRSPPPPAARRAHELHPPPPTTRRRTSAREVEQ